MAFSGGSYEDVARWIWNFLTSHAKREDPRIEALLDRDDAGKSYRVRFVLEDAMTPPIEFDYADVAPNRGSLAWCRALAERARAFVREHLLATNAPPSPPSVRTH